MVASCSPAGPATAASAPAALPAVQVEVYSVAQHKRDGVISASGLVAFKSETSLSFNAAGEIESILVDDGDKVYAGQKLATLRRTSVGADVAEAEIVRNTAQQTFDRTQRLFESGAASQADLDAARLALERTRGSVSIIAPATGVVLRRDAERGQIVSVGQPVLQIGEDRAGVIVKTSVTSTDVQLVQVGDTAEIQVRGRGSRSGTVARISPKMVDGMGSFEVEVRFTDASDLRSGEVADVLIAAKTTGAPAAPIFIIPAIALIDARADQGMVYVVGADGKASRRAVQTEGVTDAGVLVTGGLAPGDAVITRGASMVRDGDFVNVSRD